MDARGMTVKWVRGPLVVHLYRMGQEVEEVQAPAFQGRTTLLREDMAEGKVTLRIHQVQLSDTGWYTCYFQAGPLYNETSFHLHVAENRPTSQKRVKIIVPVSLVVFIGVLLVLGICFFYQRNLQRHRGVSKWPIPGGRQRNKSDQQGAIYLSQGPPTSPRAANHFSFREIGRGRWASITTELIKSPYFCSPFSPWDF
ncbi:myelin-oligodendrocyte glycoprotein-like isoform X1 [Dromiciops gliroides]|uniref:myelin-oligodendrocyte glycoprotein-like isoform X1 n=1 Tax=Dromiciops gliroides TaxID=33562 RepID=UPI001CC46327|nr:myelin-oligodendrocyte glycoprotein-like isoform X1 [Dromiciops gliroides]